ncbi:hypothetical protein EA772_17475 [Pedobacter sp. G11]|uniref:hypothetical protein n=1 Tax=Pedobacter sp. G11 TaxID=2482728 RepID=UPI000F5F5350|nr:hypothetical protein [Pedobacter sp. G11]AZI27035.1 hypothetical protein EA772_17475 [Pedobacter sp. G11]
MAFDWIKYLIVAENLKSSGTEESCRSGISRAYYAVFGRAKIFCINQSIVKTKDLNDNRNKIHSFLINSLVESDHPELFEIGKNIETLRVRRNDADYNADCKESGKISVLEDSILIVNGVLKKINDYEP